MQRFQRVVVFPQRRAAVRTYRHFDNRGLDGCRHFLDQG